LPLCKTNLRPIHVVLFDVILLDPKYNLFEPSNVHAWSALPFFFSKLTVCSLALCFKPVEEQFIDKVCFIMVMNSSNWQLPPLVF
jgi:hypothetical protein